jgi:hemolysin III
VSRSGMVEVEKTLTRPAADVALDPPVKPLLRGWLHAACFVASLPAGILVVAAAGPARARVSAIVYALALTALFGVSASYHRGHWSAIARKRMQRLDHATIFVMIAACYTPICLIALHGATAKFLLIGAWAGALAGIVLVLTGMAHKWAIGLICYIGLGWLAVIAMPQLSRTLSGIDFALIVTGGGVYTLGAIVLATRWPDPFPRVFGYHEVWHVMVAGACICHYLAIAELLRAAG